MMKFIESGSPSGPVTGIFIFGSNTSIILFTEAAIVGKRCLLFFISRCIYDSNIYSCHKDAI